MATTETSHNHDDYWKLPHYDMTAKAMKAELDKRNFRTSSCMEKWRLREHLRRSDMGVPSYAFDSCEDLRGLIVARNIDVEDMARFRGGTVSDLISILDEGSFHDFIRLPPELRNRIYEMYFAEFNHKPLYAPSQPPLTKTNSLVRRETLPMFYDRCTFELPLHRYTTAPRSQLRIPNPVLLSFRCTMPEHLNLVRRLRICVRPSPNISSIAQDGFYRDFGSSMDSIFCFELI